MSTQWSIRAIALAGTIWGLATLIGCGDDLAGPSGTTTYVAQLSGANEVPAIPGGASGTATFTLTGRSLSYTVNVDGLSGNAAASHIHMGAAGSNGGILYPFTAAPVQSGQVASGTIDLNQPISNGSSSITGDSLLTLLNQGLLYTNVHTAAHAGGEIRGQILRSQTSGSSGSGSGSGSGNGSGY